MSSLSRLSNDSPPSSPLSGFDDDLNLPSDDKGYASGMCDDSFPDDGIWSHSDYEVRTPYVDRISIYDLPYTAAPRYKREFDKVLPKYPTDLIDLIFQYTVSYPDDYFPEINYLMSQCYENFSLEGENQGRSPLKSEKDKVVHNQPVPGEALSLTQRFTSLWNHNIRPLSLQHLATNNELNITKLYEGIQYYLFKKDNKKMAASLDKFTSEFWPVRIYDKYDAFHVIYSEARAQEKEIASAIEQLPKLENRALSIQKQSESSSGKIRKAFKHLHNRFRPYLPGRFLGKPV